MAAPRNRTGIQFAALRDGFDQRFEAVHDALEVAYYQFWRQGLPSAVTVGPRTYDVIVGVPTIVLGAAVPPTTTTFPGMSAKEFFDTLHGLIWQQYTVQFHQRNLAQPADQRIPTAKYDDITDNAGNVIGSRAAIAQAAIDAQKSAGIEFTVP